MPGYILLATGDMWRGAIAAELCGGLHDITASWCRRRRTSGGFVVFGSGLVDFSPTCSSDKHMRKPQVASYCQCLSIPFSFAVAYHSLGVVCLVYYESKRVTNHFQRHARQDGNKRLLLKQIVTSTNVPIAW
mmetsp:Transcript_84575/g.137099  ORF Transcript_84575/g.137099 Transcript_84575/m.137099 type:complete len:132 (+) Transcript_84575:354-749(+)